ncbi:MAG: MarR family transcriptional regulator [Actinobacteria bacterium]|nr:MarR family transcriptional regulator [Actinomycetota bacterium]
MDDVTPRLAALPTWLLGQADARAHRILVEALSEHGFRGYHYRVLATLGDGGPVSQSVLGRGAGLDRSDVATTVDDLQARGLVARTPDPSDRRRNVVALTPPGRRLLGRLDTAVAQAQDAVLAPLTPAERTRFVALLARLHP